MGDLERALSRNTLLIPAVSLAIGIASGLNYDLSWLTGFILLLAAVIIYLILVYICKNPLSTYRFRNYHYIWLAFGFCAIGIIISSLHTTDYHPLSTNIKYNIVGEVSDIKEMTYGDAMIVDTKNIASPASHITEDSQHLKLKVNVIGGGNFSVGDIITFQSDLKLIQDSKNSFYKGYQEMMNRKGIYYVCNVYDRDITLINHRNSLTYYSVIMRDGIERIIENSGLNKNTQNFLITILLGDRNYLDPNLKNTFSEAGVTHILALSGMHVAIIGAIFLMILFPFNFYGRYKLRYLIATIMLWIYAFISGMAPSTIRACIMISFATVSIVSERKNYALNALSGSVLLILLWNPDTLFDVGFQLSIVCVSALILFTDVLNRFSQRYDRFLYRISEIIGATLIATAASWVWTCYYFNSFPLAFLPANLLLLPLLPLYLVIAIIYIVFSFIGTDLSVLRVLLDLGYELFDKLLILIGRNTSIELHVSMEAVILWTLGLVMLALFINLYKWKLYLFSGLTFLILSVVIIIMDKSMVPEGSFIITDSYNSFTLNIKKSIGEQEVSIKRYSNMDIRIGSNKILIIDTDNPLLQSAEQYDYIIFGGGFKGEIESILDNYKNSTIILHPSIRRKKENEFINRCLELKVSVHSLRQDQSLTVIADKK